MTKFLLTISTLCLGSFLHANSNDTVIFEEIYAVSFDSSYIQIDGLARRSLSEQPTRDQVSGYFSTSTSQSCLKLTPIAMEKEDKYVLQVRGLYIEMTCNLIKRKHLSKIID